MKRLTSLMLALSLILTLAACSPQAKQPPFHLNLSLTDPFLQCDAFSEPLEPLEADLVWMLYGMEEAGLAREDLAGAIAFRSTGASCEELALLTFSDEAASQTAVNALKLYLSSQVESNRSYRPEDLPKLEQAFLERRGTSVLLMVANDPEAARNLLAS